MGFGNRVSIIIMCCQRESTQKNKPSEIIANECIKCKIWFEYSVVLCVWHICKFGGCVGVRFISAGFEFDCVFFLLFMAINSQYIQQRRISCFFSILLKLILAEKCRQGTTEEKKARNHSTFWALKEQALYSCTFLVVLLVSHPPLIWWKNK